MRSVSTRYLRSGRRCSDFFCSLHLFSCSYFYFYPCTGWRRDMFTQWAGVWLCRVLVSSSEAQIEKKQTPFVSLLARKI